MVNDKNDANGAYVLDDQVGFLLRLASQRHTNVFQNLVPHGLTPTQFAALARLSELGECSQNELGRRTAMDVATIKGVVDRLRNKGLVTIKADPNDKRRSLLSVVDAHKGIATELHEAGHAISKETLKPLSPGDRKEFLRMLKIMSA